MIRKLIIFINVYLLRLGHIIPRDYNPADFYIKKLAVLPNKKEKCLNDLKVIYSQMN